MQLFHQYLDLLRNDNGKLSSFWMSYVDMVEIILGLLRSSREGDFLLHLASIMAMIPWCFSYDRLNYARYLPIYYAQMSNLDHPVCMLTLCKGGFGPARRYQPIWKNSSGSNHRRDNQQRHANPWRDEGL